MKLNLGCGRERLEGYLNVDRLAEAPVQWDLETCPWPWEDSSAEAVRMHHVLEHLGATPTAYLRIIQELYRVCSDGATVDITVPHPRHDDFLTDPTHVRPILAESFQLFSRRKCEVWVASGAANSTLALSLGVDFEIEQVSHSLDPLWHAQLQAGTMKAEELNLMARQVHNVIKETRIQLRVVKRAS